MNLYKQTECPKRIAVAVLSFSSTLWVDLFKPSSLHPHCHPLSVRLESCMTGNGGQSLETQLHWPRMDLQYFDPLHLWNHLTHWDTPSCHPPLLHLSACWLLPIVWHLHTNNSCIYCAGLNDEVLTLILFFLCHLPFVLLQNAGVLLNWWTSV